MKKVLILHTGGTIGMSSDDKNMKTTDVQELFFEAVPELSKLARIDVLIADNIDSSQVTPKHWVKWLQALKNQYHKYDGFVVTHGTDTMSYTGSAFSFAMGTTTKPVILTGSQRPLRKLRTDAKDNLINSVEMAVSGPPEVAICFGNRLMRATRTTKLSATDYVAFETYNYPELAHFGLDIESYYEKSVGQKPKWKMAFDENVFCFKVFPGVSGEILKGAALNPHCHGIVLEGFGSGTIPVFDDSVLGMITTAKKLKKPVVIVSQCPHGRVDLDLYAVGSKAKKAGAISAGDMTSEAALVKVMHGLGLGLSIEGFQKYFSKNVCGERSF